MRMHLLLRLRGPASRWYHASAPTGLYGFHQLSTAGGFQHFVDDAIQRSNDLVSFISSMPPPAHIIQAMDDISDTVCSVVDSAELCRHTHPDRDYVEEANKASLKMNEYLHYLNTNRRLYDAVKKAEHQSDSLTEEAQMAARNLRIDSEKGGIHLCEGKLDRVNELNIDISSLYRQFSENVINDPGYIDVFPASRIPIHLRNFCKPILQSSSGGSTRLLKSKYNQKDRGFRIMTEPAILSSILQGIPDEEVRKLAYIKGNSVPRANIDVLDKLIAARHELAQIIGHKSYADFAIQQNMAMSSRVVVPFLIEMSEIVKEKADKEFQAIWNVKREKCGGSSSELEPWDEAYYTAVMKSSAFNLDSSVVASFFPLPQCVEGLNTLVKSLFGATFCSIPMAPGESWHPDVLKLSLHHPEEGDLGILYLDLYSRAGKYPGCAHFAIRGGRKISDTEYQLPVVALVCNFSLSSGLSIARLTHCEVETLFHEFGHALHSLLSRTDYQHFSGTRVVLDLAETPSNLFEYYASDYRVLRTFAKHYTTGETIPEKLVESMQAAKNMFAATELQRQIFYAFVDQTLFGEEAASSRDTSLVIADLKRRYTSWKHVDGTHWQTRFTHLINYGAGYYSYLYAKCFAATIWKKLCQEDPLSSATGTALRTRFLQHGGAKEASALLNDLVGGGILKEHDGGIVPDVTCLCEEMNVVR